MATDQEPKQGVEGGAGLDIEEYGPVPILVEKGMAYSPESHGEKT